MRTKKPAGAEEILRVLGMGGVVLAESERNKPPTKWKDKRLLHCTRCGSDFNRPVCLDNVRAAISKESGANGCRTCGYKRQQKRLREAAHREEDIRAAVEGLDPPHQLVVSSFIYDPEDAPGRPREVEIECLVCGAKGIRRSSNQINRRSGCSDLYRCPTLKPDPFERIAAEFALYGFGIVRKLREEENRAVNTTAFIVRHDSCGTSRSNSISLQKARYAGFEICPVCHGAEERKFSWTLEEVRVEAARRLNAAVIGTYPDDVVFVRTPVPEDHGHVLTQFEAQCRNVHDDGRVCSHNRVVTMNTLLRPSGNGCGVCCRNVLTSEMIVDRAALMGLHVAGLEAYRNIETVLHFRCADGHEWDREWSCQRGRGCGQCSNSYGERLLGALCRHYWPGRAWKPEFPVVGLDPADPQRTLFYDWACPAERIAIECHSEYHNKDASPDHFLFTNISKEERQRLDDLKRAANALGGPLEGWAYAEVNLEQAAVSKIVSKASGSFIDAVVEDFRSQLNSGGIILPDRPPPRSEELLSAFSEGRVFAQQLAAHGLSADGAMWWGRSHEYRIRCECGHSWKAFPRELEARWAEGRLGCSRCARTAA